VRRLDTQLDGPVLLESDVHGDARGFFLETGRANELAGLGVADRFVQDNQSRSAHGVLRGMHFQPCMAKLIRCARGRVFDVVVDIRPGSPAFGRWEWFELNDANHHQLYCPDGFAHGFCVVSDVADVIYRCSAYYDPELESGFRFDDPEVGIEWPAIELVTSDRDSRAPLLSELRELLEGSAPQQTAH
jgi:dTDP-4-dehydrorhamnose 3,5-epimerase